MKHLANLKLDNLSLSPYEEYCLYVIAKNPRKRWRLKDLFQGLQYCEIKEVKEAEFRSALGIKTIDDLVDKDFVIKISYPECLELELKFTSKGQIAYISSRSN